MQPQPTLLSSCARATTAAETRYRISYPEFTRRDSRVIALDEQAADIVRQLAGQPWSGGHFLVFESALPDDALLRPAVGGTALLSEELDGADAVVMVATAQASAEACARRLVARRVRASRPRALSAIPSARGCSSEIGRAHV